MGGLWSYCVSRKGTENQVGRGTVEECVIESSENEPQQKGSSEESDSEGSSEESDSEGSSEESDSEGSGEESDSEGSGEESDSKGSGEESDSEGSGEESNSGGSGEELDSEGSGEESDSYGYEVVHGEENVRLAAYGSQVILEVSRDNIIDLDINVDSIVNFVYSEDIYGRHGIIEAAGEQVKQEYDAKRSKKKNRNKQLVIATAPGDLPYKAIFHVHVAPELPKFSYNIQQALKSADKEGMRSIAFPALKYTPANKEYIDRYLQEFYEFENTVRPMCLHMIDIICNCKEDEKYHDAQIIARGESMDN